MPGTQTTVHAKGELEATHLVAMESALAQLEAQKSPLLESYIVQKQKDIEALRNKAAKAGRGSRGSSVPGGSTDGP